MSAQQTVPIVEAGLITREQAKAMVDRVLAMSQGDQTRINIVSSTGGNTRFADASITTSGEIANVSVTVTVTLGRRRASSSTNAMDDASLRRTVERATSLARVAPEDPELMPELGPQTYASVGAFREATADLVPEGRAAAVRQAVEAATATGRPAGTVFVAGFLDTSTRAIAVGTSTGLFAYHRTTEAEFSTTSRTPDGTGSGWSAAGSRDWGRIDTARLGRIAAQKAVASRSPQPFEAGMHTAILEPLAVADLVPLLAGALGARDADEGRSAFSKPGGGTRVGETVVDERVTLYSDPVDADLLAAPFDDEGLPVQRTVWIDKGVLRNLSYSRFWAQKMGRAPTGGGVLTGGLALAGGTKTTEQMIAETERCVLVTRLWYIRALDPRTVLQTGLTRDGVFLVENGKITRSLKNFRWNESPLLMLNRLEEIGRPEPVAAGLMMPALRIRGFNFTSSSDAV
jgi:predicted Zn-dependent protease